MAKLWGEAGLLTNPRVMATLLLGFSSGLPLALSGGTLQAWYTVAGVNIVAIGALSLVGMPYAYKPLWAPLMDRFVPPLLGRRRGWVLLMQLAMVAMLSVMAFSSPSKHPAGLALLALGLAFFSASHDIAFDAYRTDLLPAKERGIGAAMNTAGYRIAMLVSGGLAIVMAGTIGWHWTYLIMAGLMLIEIGVTVWAPEPELQAHVPSTIKAAIVEPFREFLGRKSALWLLVFIVVYKLADAFALSLTTPFLIRGLGFSLVDVGAIYKLVGMIATMLGVFLGGILIPRMGMFKSLLYFGILQGISNLLFLVLAMVGKSYSLMVLTVFVENLCGGLGTVAFVAFLMSLCDLRYTATQFALLSALSAVGRIFIGPVAGVVVADYGWVLFFLLSVVCALPGLGILWFLGKAVINGADVHQQSAS